MSPHPTMRSGDSDDPRSQRNGSETQDSQAPNTPQAVRNTAACGFVGDHTDGVTPVPIPNTAVKPIGPMIVPLVRKSVIAGILQPDALEPPLQGVFLCALPLPQKRSQLFSTPCPAPSAPPKNKAARPFVRFRGLTVLRRNGETVSRFDGFAAMRFRESTAGRFCGLTVSRPNGLTVSRRCGSTVSRFYGVAVSRLCGDAV